MCVSMCGCICPEELASSALALCFLWDSRGTGNPVERDRGVHRNSDEIVITQDQYLQTWGAATTGY